MSEWYYSNEGRYGKDSIETVSIYGSHQAIEFAALSIDCLNKSKLSPNLRYSFTDVSGQPSHELTWWKEVGGMAKLIIGNKAFDFGRVTEPRPVAHPFMLSSHEKITELDLINLLRSSKEKIKVFFTVLDNKYERVIELSMKGFPEKLSQLTKTCRARL
jgi:hypothetical protein